MTLVTQPHTEPDAAAAFATEYGHSPTGVWSAPGRVNLIGEHTDYNNGFVLPFAIDYRTVAAVAPNRDRLVRVTSSASPVAHTASLDDIEAATFADWSGYALGIPWAMARSGIDLADKPGVDIAIESNVPIGAGLSSSAAIESAIAVALNDLWDLGLSRTALARIGQLAENGAVGAPTGIMDQMASLTGTAEHAVMLDCDSLDARLVPLALQANDLTALVIDTQLSHSHATGGYADRRAACEQGASALGVASLRQLRPEDLDRAAEALDPVTFRRVRHVVTENERVLAVADILDLAGPRSIGGLMLESHASMRDDFEISVPEIDCAVTAAMSAGAVGARLTGGGFGGAAIALVGTDDIEAVSAGINAECDEQGFDRPRILAVTPSDGARRDA